MRFCMLTLKRCATSPYRTRASLLLVGMAIAMLIALPAHRGEAADQPATSEVPSSLPTDDSTSTDGPVDPSRQPMAADEVVQASGRVPISPVIVGSRPTAGLGQTAPSRLDSVPPTSGEPTSQPLPESASSETALGPTRGTQLRIAGNATPEPLRRLLSEGPGDFDPPIEPATFLNVQPGRTSAAELEEAWGTPLETHRRDGLLHYVYEIEGYRSVAATVMDGMVTSILIEVDNGRRTDTLIERLGMNDVTPVDVEDLDGQVLGLALPERGVLFSYDPQAGQDVVSQVLLETIDPQPFVLRAKKRIDREPVASWRDVDYALQLDDQLAEAHWLRAQVLHRAGHFDDALQAAEAAVLIDDKDLRFKLARAKMLAATGQPPRAIDETKAVIELCEDSQLHIKAEALWQLGNLVANGPERDFKAAIEYHIQSIRLAEGLIDNPHPEIRDRARRVLLGAYLATATDVGWGTWRRKDEIALKWLKKAHAQLEALELPREDFEDWAFHLAAASLAVDVGIRGKLNPGRWLDAVERIGQLRLERTDDPIARAEITWEIGLAMYDALQVAQLRGATDLALSLGQITAEHLERGAAIKSQRRDVPYMMGRLYYRIGSLYATEGGGHKAALEWFDRAVPLMLEPIPDSAAADLGRQGETLIGMAVSYWEVGQREASVQLTEAGLRLMRKAVDHRVLPESALAVPYHNLAVMLRQLGQSDKAQSYARLAEAAENPSALAR